MRKIILSLNVTRDDFYAGPDGSLDWHFPYWNVEMDEALGKLLTTCDTILLGRNTYNAFASYWITKGNTLGIVRGDLAMADMMNRYRKVVVSASSGMLPWVNSQLLYKDLLSEIKKLKLMPGKNIMVLGSCQLVSYLVDHDLIDEYYLWVHPINIRQGKRLPKLTAYLAGSEPLHSEKFTCGVIKLYYDKQGASTPVFKY